MPPTSKQKKDATASQGFDADLDAVTAAMALDTAEAEPILRRFLTHRSNLVVARAAKAVGKHQLTDLTEELATAFHRFLPAAGNPVKTDPQCWAKNEVARVLAAFEYQSYELFVAGTRHIQREPVWGTTEDTAGPLRGTCALALVQCRELTTSEVLRHLIPLFSDTDLPVRVNAARAMEQLGNDSAALLLRLRAELASDTLEVRGACLGAVLGLEGTPALPWAARFLQAEDDLAGEAAFLLAEHRSPDAATLLRQAFAAADSQEFRVTLLSALVAMRTASSYKTLLDLMGEHSMFAGTIRDLLLASDPPAEVLQQLASFDKG